MLRSLIAAAMAFAVVAPALPAHARGKRQSFVDHGLVSTINAKLKRWVRPTGKCPFGYAERLATYYWQGRRTANGERFYPDGLTVALRSRDFGQHLHVINPHNGRAVTVRHNDFGPATIAHMDLSRGAAHALGMRASIYVCVK